MARNDYSPAERAAWQQQRLAAERARGEHMRGINQLPSYQTNRAPQTLVADLPSKCFDDLRWKNGTAYATFNKGGEQYLYPMTRTEFEDWADSESLGGFFNDEVR
jgi:hypothetical protein